MSKYPVILAGAGIGGRDNMTLALYKALSRADVIVYDRLMDPTILDFAPNAEKIYVGKAAEKHTMAQEDIQALLENYYRAGKRVIRLKGGDPYVFGRGGEEALYLSQRSIPFRVISGITSGVAVPAMAGIPVTQRDVATSVSFITGHRAKGESDFSLRSRARNPGLLHGAEKCSKNRGGSSCGRKRAEHALRRAEGFRRRRGNVLLQQA